MMRTTVPGADLRRGSVLAFGVAALVAVLAGCGGGAPGDGGQPGSGDATSPPASATPSAPTGGDGPGGDGDGGPGGDDPGGGSPPPGDDGLPADACGSGEFSVGSWSRPGPGSADTLSGVSATGHADCARVLFDFDGPAPGVRVIRTSLDNHTIVTFEGDTPDGPVSPDLITPGLELVTGAFVASGPGGASVRVLHGDHTELAARAAPAEGGVAVYFRELRPGDTERGPVTGRVLDLSLDGQPERGLIVLEVRAEDSTGNVVVEGYAKAPESNVVMRVYDAGGAEVCSEHGPAGGPPYLFSRFTRSCDAGGAGTYDLEVGWPDPAGTDPVWSRYEVTLG